MVGSNEQPAPKLVGSRQYIAKFYVRLDTIVSRHCECEFVTRASTGELLSEKGTTDAYSNVYIEYFL